MRHCKEVYTKQKKPPWNRGLKVEQKIENNA